MLNDTSKLKLVSSKISRDGVHASHADDPVAQLLSEGLPPLPSSITQTSTLNLDELFSDAKQDSSLDFMEFSEYQDPLEGIKSKIEKLKKNQDRLRFYLDEIFLNLNI